MVQDMLAKAVSDVQDEVVLPLAENGATPLLMHQCLERRQCGKAILVAVAALTLLSATVVVCSRQTSALAPSEAKAAANEIISLAPIRSGNVIKEWQADGGKSRNAKKDHEPRQMDVESTTAIVRCCPASGSGKGMTPEDCKGNITWQEALDSCCQQSGHYRLCTKDELAADVAEGTGCNGDKKLVWTRQSKSVYFQSHGTGSVCRLDASDECCDGRGTVQIHHSTDPAACEEKCRADHACTGYESDSNDNYCEIWTQPITHYEIRDPKYVCKRKVNVCPVKI